MKDISSSISGPRSVGGALESTRTPSRSNGVSDSAFREQLTALQNTVPSQPAKAPGQASSLKFSSHAIDRMQSRGISFSPDQMAKIESAVNKASSKGAKNTLLLTDDNALIVSVKDNTVVTVMDKSTLKDNVFTNIDSTVMV
jgi:flagellar operon protein